MDVSPDGLDFIRAFERLSLTAYLDSADCLTIGWGHLIRSGESFPREGITLDRANGLFHRDVQIAVEGLRRCLPPGTALQQHEADALVSFIFNLGEEAFRTSTLRQRLIMGDQRAAAHEFRRWKYETRKGQKVPNLGLLRRRIAEELMFLGGARDSFLDLANKAVLHD
jgi:lysozyme